MVDRACAAHDRSMTERPSSEPLGPPPEPAPTDQSPPPGSPPPGSPPPGSPPPGSPPPTVGLPVGATLHRSRDNRVVAGVCGGLGEATRVDPIIYRVLAVVLTFFGGVGLLLYAIGWLLLPESDTGASIADRALGRRGQTNGRTGPVVLAVALVVVAAIGIGAALDHASATLLLLVSLGALWLLLRRDQAPAPAGVWGTAAAAPPQAPATAAAAGAPPTQPVPTPAPADTPWAPTASPSGTPGGPGAPGGPYATFGATPPPPPPKPRREPSILGPLTWSLALIGLGLLTLIDFTGADVAFAAYPALALAIVGLGLLAGTWYGRSRGLIALGLVAAFALCIASVADAGRPYQDRWVRARTITVTDVGAIQPTYDFGFGRSRLDLSSVDFTDHTVRTMIDGGVGELIVIVPREVDVLTDIDVGLGEMLVFGQHRDGDSVKTQIRDDGPDGPGGGQLELRIDQGLGRVEVRREAA